MMNYKLESIEIYRDRGKIYRDNLPAYLNIDMSKGHKELRKYFSKRFRYQYKPSILGERYDLKKYYDCEVITYNEQVGDILGIDMDVIFFDKVFIIYSYNNQLEKIVMQEHFNVCKLNGRAYNTETKGTSYNLGDFDNCSITVLEHRNGDCAVRILFKKE